MAILFGYWLPLKPRPFHTVLLWTFRCHVPYTTQTTTTNTTTATAITTNTLHCTNCITLHQTTLHYPYITLHSLHHHNATATTLHSFQYTTTTTPLHYNYNCSCTTSHYKGVVGEVTDQVTTATIVTTPNNTTPTTFQSISRIALPSVIHNSQALL